MFAWTVKRMAVSFESYFLLNFVMNTLVIAIIARSQSGVYWSKIFLASIIGAVYAIAMQVEVFSLLKWFPLRLILAFVLSAIAFPIDGWMDVIKGGTALLLGTVFTGGLLELLLRFIPGTGLLWFIISAVIAFIALLFALSFRARSLEQMRVRLAMTTDYGSVKIPALIDTGNRLREPLSGRPVVIVEEERLKKILPPGFDSEKAIKQLPMGFRFVRYSALGNTGSNMMLCFRPRDVFASFGRGWMRAPDIWVALYPGKMPGGECALAPAVIGAIQTTLGSSGRNRLGSTERRINR